MAHYSKLCILLLTTFALAACNSSGSGSSTDPDNGDTSTTPPSLDSDAQVAATRDFLNDYRNFQDSLDNFAGPAEAFAEALESEADQLDQQEIEAMGLAMLVVMIQIDDQLDTADDGSNAWQNVDGTFQNIEDPMSATFAPGSEYQVEDDVLTAQGSVTISDYEFPFDMELNLPTSLQTEDEIITSAVRFFFGKGSNQPDAPGTVGLEAQNSNLTMNLGNSVDDIMNDDIDLEQLGDNVLAMHLQRATLVLGGITLTADGADADDDNGLNLVIDNLTVNDDASNSETAAISSVDVHVSGHGLLEVDNRSLISSLSMTSESRSETVAETDDDGLFRDSAINTITTTFNASTQMNSGGQSLKVGLEDMILIVRNIVAAVSPSADDTDQLVELEREEIKLDGQVTLTHDDAVFGLFVDVDSYNQWVNDRTSQDLLSDVVDDDNTRFVLRHANNDDDVEVAIHFYQESDVEIGEIRVNGDKTAVIRWDDANDRLIADFEQEGEEDFVIAEL